MTEKLLVPDIGEFEGVEVIEILVQEGQEIKKNDPIVTIESDKSSVEIPSTIEGKIETLNVKIGDKVSKGDLLLTIKGTKISTKTSEDVPKNTENLIKEAENSLEKSYEEIIEKPIAQSQQTTNKILIKEENKPDNIQVVNKGDIDPTETNEWLESLSAVIQKDGNQRAHYLSLIHI